MAVQTLAGHRYLVSVGMQSPSIGRWQIDGGGPLTRHLADGYGDVEYSPSGRWLLGVGWSDEAGHPFGAVWDADDHQVLTLPEDMADVEWLDGDRLAVVTADGHTRVIDVSTGATRDARIMVQPEVAARSRMQDGSLRL
jgi:hypothetical protein